MSLDFQPSLGHEEGFSAPLVFTDSSELYNVFQGQAMFPDEDAALFINPSACQSSVKSSQNWQNSKWITSPEVTSPTELQVDFDSPNENLLPSPSPSSPSSGRMSTESKRSTIEFQESDGEDNSAKTSPTLRTRKYVNEDTPNNSKLLKRQRTTSPRRQRIKNSGETSQNTDDVEEEEDEEEEEEDDEYTPAPNRRGRGKRIRQPHSIVEQRYRNSLNAEIRRLQMAVPHLADFQLDNFRSGRPQPTKATIIASAVQYIKTIEAERDALLAAERTRQKINSWR